MVKLGLENAYELLRRGRRPRSTLTRKLTPRSAFARVRSLARDVRVRDRVIAELSAAGLSCDASNFEAVLASALDRHEVALFRRSQLQLAWGGGAQPIPIMALAGPEAEPAPAAAAEDAPVESAPASPYSSALEQAANVLAGVLQQAANSGAALAHTCLDCEICRRQQQA